MQIVPVLDLLDGQVVRGVAGRRSEYRPIKSLLVDTTNPLDVARAFRSRFELSTLYVADLDGILHGRPNWDIYRDLSRHGFQLWIDAGLRTNETARQVISCGADSLIVGLESCPDPALLEALCREFGDDRIIFSLDLQSGTPMGDLAAWSSCKSTGIVKHAANIGVQRLIVLDLAHVGVSAGPVAETIELCRYFRHFHPDGEVITGGGIRNANDLIDLANAGIDAALVASALHDGRLTAADIERVSSGASP